MVSNLADKKITIINQIPISQNTATKIEWYKHVLNNCSISNGIFDKSSGMTVYKANSGQCFIFDYEKYKEPNFLEGGYYSLSHEDKETYFTANIGDLVVLDEINDAQPETVQQFQSLVSKYRDNGGLITNVQGFIQYDKCGKAWETNHIEITRG